MNNTFLKNNEVARGSNNMPPRNFLVAATLPSQNNPWRMIQMEYGRQAVLSSLETGRWTWDTQRVKWTVLSLALLLYAGRLASAANYYVAANGSDSNPGTLAQPFATLEKARASMSLGDTTYVRGGTYIRSGTFTLTSADSGTTYRAYTNESPILLGGSALSNWVTYSGNILMTDVSTQGFGSTAFGQLFFDGERQILARYPNYNPTNYHAGWLYTQNPSSSLTQLYYNPPDWHNWTNVSELQVFFHPYLYNWWNKISGISSVDTANHIITLSSPDTASITLSNRYFVQNSLQELDAPGEWYLNANTHWLYFYPPTPISGTNPVYVPVLANLVTIGSGTHDVVWRGFTMECCTNSAVILSSCTNTLIAGNTIKHVGDWRTYGVQVSGGYSNGVVGNDISYCGFHGVYATGGDRVTLTPANHYIDNNYMHHCGVYNKRAGGVGLMGTGIRMTHNYIHDCPRVGVYLEGGANYLVAFNEIHDAPVEDDDCGAIYFGADGDWISDRGSLVLGNYIHDIQGYGFCEGKYLSRPCLAYGLYLDGFTCGVDAVSNVFNNCSWSGIYVNGGRDNRLWNNIFLNNDSAAIYVATFDTSTTYWANHYPSMLDAYNSVIGQPAWAALHGMGVSPSTQWPGGHTMGGLDVATNVISYTNLTAAVYWWSGNYAAACENVTTGTNRFDYNTYYHNGQSFNMSDLGNNYNFGEWQASGWDAHSLANDPLLNPDLTVQTSSPALTLGFQQINLSNVGCYRDEYRASWPLPGATLHRPLPPTNLVIVNASP